MEGEMALGRHVRRASIIMVAGTLALLLPPAAAHADTTIGDGVTLTSSGPQAFALSTNVPYWSVVALQPVSTSDDDLKLRSSTGSTTFGTSTLGTGKTDFVAINTNGGFQPTGSYQALVLPFSGSGGYAIQYVQGHTVINLPTPANDGVSGAGDPDITFAVLSNDKVVSVADIFLSAGQKFWATTTTAGNRLYLLESNPASPSTFFRSRGLAGTAVHSVVDGCTLYTATYGGWHALAVVADRSPTAPGAGIGFALHRFNPAKPTTCPVKNFPAPTPA
jgi:hypothetical protein